MKKKLSNEELITFCGQMALILKSGISSLEGIYIREGGKKNWRMRKPF